MVSIKKVGDDNWFYYVVIVDGVIIDRCDTYEEAKHAY